MPTEHVVFRGGCAVAGSEDDLLEWARLHHVEAKARGVDLEFWTTEPEPHGEFGLCFLLRCRSRMPQGWTDPAKWFGGSIRVPLSVCKTRIEIVRFPKDIHDGESLCERVWFLPEELVTGITGKHGAKIGFRTPDH